MKLAEALQERADLNIRIQQLRSRLENNAFVQEGEQPAENPDDLLRELNESVKRLEWLICRINLTNCSSTAEGQTLTELIAKKDALSLNLSVYRELINTRRFQERYGDSRGSRCAERDGGEQSGQPV